jgi:outer membrane receptor protein involved in Fe transport
MMPRIRQVLVFLFTVLLTSAVFGQGTTSTLSGTVTDSSGAALPGVTVTVTSPALQGERTATTGDAGTYLFPSLPPGAYTVTFDLSGMQKITQKMTLSLAQAGRADAQLKVSAVTEAITVTATAPAVLESPGVSTNFTNEMISKLPVARNIRDTTLLAPGVNPNGVNRQITINGGPSYDNIFLVNGVVVNENLRGQPHNLFIEDAIAETTVITTGISAEYGRFTGGVVSTLTKSGGNDFSGTFRDSFTNSNWTDTPEYPGATAGVDKTNQVYEATFGGRIIRDRLWFFGAGRKAKTSTSRVTFQTGIPYNNAFDEKRYEGKLTAQITPKHNLIGSYLDVKNTELNNATTPLYDLDGLVPSRELPNSLQSVNYNGILTSSLVAEAQWSHKKFAFINSGGRSTDRIIGTWVQDSVSGGFSHAAVFCGVCTPEERNSGGEGGKLTYFLSTKSMGSHSIAVGGDRFQEERIVNNHQSGSDFVVVGRVVVSGTQDYPRFDNSTTLTWQPILLNSDGTDLSSDAYFINDKWDFNNHFSFNLGARYDKNHAVNADGELISDDSNYSPRLGLIYDVRGDGRHRVTANFARYATKIGDGSNVFSTSQAAGNPGTFQWTYRVCSATVTTDCGPAINPAGTTNFTSYTDALKTLFAWFDARGGTNNTNYTSVSYPGFGSIFRESLKTPVADEYTLGYGFQINPRAYVRIDGVRREWHHFYARQVNEPLARIIPPNNIPGDMSVTVNDDDFTTRKYNAIELQGNWNVSQNLVLGGNYTHSTLKGNDVGEGGGTATIRNTPSELFYPEFFNYPNRRPSGYLGQDRTHRARVWGSYNLHTPVGSFAISAIESYDSGFAYSAVGSIDATGRNNNFRGCTAAAPNTLASPCFAGLPANPGYILNGAGTTTDYYFSKRGEFRTADRLATDLALVYSLPLWGKFEFFARGDLLNVFNTSAIVDPSLLNTDVITSRTGSIPTVANGQITAYNSGLRPFNPFTQKPIECPQGNSAQQCYDMGANWQKGPNFGKANSADAYQVPDRALAPRTYRFSLGVRF